MPFDLTFPAGGAALVVGGSGGVGAAICASLAKAGSPQRGGVRREHANWVIAGHLPDPTLLVSPDPRQLVALQRFCLLMNQLHARPKAHVSYLREAWISREDNSVRVTLDREVRSEIRCRRLRARSGTPARLPEFDA